MAPTLEQAVFWFDRLSDDLDARADTFDLLDDYYRGEQTIPVTATKAVREAYQRLMHLSRTNFSELIVEAVRERMRPQAFRTGAVGDETGDQEAWRIWQANSLDADISLLLIPQLALGAAYTIVGPVDPETNAPVITPEDPREVVCAHDPVRRRNVIAALKRFRDPNRGADLAYVYLPGGVFRFIREATGDVMRPGTDDFELEAADPLPDNVGVPVVPFLNRPDRYYRTTSEIEPHLGLLDRINYTILQRLEIATLQAFRQRAIKGDLPIEDERGHEIDYDDVFASDPGALWLLPATAELWESGQVDLGPIRSAIRDDVQDLAAVTRTPLYYFTPESATGSAEGASLAREGLIFKAEERIRQASESLEATMAKAFAFMGDDARASRTDMEVVWHPPERMSWSVRADAGLKALDAQVPWRTVMLDVMQFSAQEVYRMETEREAEALAAELFAAPPENDGLAPAPDDLEGLA